MTPSRRVVTVPNALCALRLAGAVALPLLAAGERRSAVLWVFAAMALSDWLDGKLAVLLDQRSVLGARLDSVADVAMYASLGAATLLLDGARVLAEWPWWGAAALAYLLAGLYGVRRLGRWPSYHTRIAKTSWLLVTVGALVFLGGGSAWPLRLALGVVALGNLESLAITRVLPEWRADVSSIFAARRIREQAAEEAS
ncbi:MAG TPA: CDP-alcohol phosphatidyltransferase family protein [Thermoanaerobaculia bacterium]|nr:CDP-alcohol phosphatidyltransferase family protein [Thermoanaerobaculia bacterium]